jgi:hypothetical protein
MYFSDLLSFYISFKNEDLKNILLSFLLFGKNAKISQRDYLNKLARFININRNFYSLCENSFLKNIIFVNRTYAGFVYSQLTSIYSSTEKGMTYYEKNLFIKYSADLIKQKKLNFSFCKEVIPSSKLDNKQIINIKDIVYVCDCLLDKNNLNNNISDDLEEMKNPFNNDKSVINGHMPFSSFEQIMKDIRINQKLIDIIIKFLQNYTMKNYLNFEDFKRLMSNLYFHVSIKYKRQFLFKMILTIANEKSSIKVSQLCKILQIENKDFKPQGTLDEKSFESIKDPIINSEIEKYIGYLDTFSLLPYLKFKVKPIGQDLIKRIINFILDNKTAEEYLDENFDKNEKFYPINMTFWKSLIEPGIIPEMEVNNYSIAEEDTAFNFEKKMENQKKEEKNDGEEKKSHRQQNESNQNKNEDNKEENNNKEKQIEKKKIEIKKKEKKKEK